MGWMERTAEKRINPSTVLPGVKSIISVALNYYTPAKHVGRPGYGKISRYAWGTDYHTLMEQMLNELDDRVKRLAPEAQTKRYVDTGPVLEKVWAERAGIGWIGKHTNVISRSIGSWLFIGEILTTLELEADTPATDHCGTCTACIEACPTGAILEGRILDASACISYWTIEHRGEIKEEFSGKFENWIFGCDICQDVCPWNRFQKESSIIEFQPRLGETDLSLSTVGLMSEQEFKARFESSPVLRTKLEGLQRNAAFLRR